MGSSLMRVGPSEMAKVQQVWQSKKAAGLMPLKVAVAMQWLPVRCRLLRAE